MAVGMFDGVHLGHRAVIESAVNLARARGGLSAVMTFSPHPSHVLRPDHPTLLIQSETQKSERVAALGVDLMVWRSFTQDLSSISAEDYMRRMKGHFPSLAGIHVGENFRFGHGRVGDVDTLLRTALAQGVHVLSIERVRYDGEPISSTRIRGLLTEGRMEEANELLGFNYCCDGKVIPGNRIGLTIGFPTLNIEWAPQCRPRFGVYAVRIRRVDAPPAEALAGVANYGLRPTLDRKTVTPLLETHLLEGSCPFGEGDELRVEWLRFIRQEMKFDGLESLKARIAIDCEAALA